MKKNKKSTKKKPRPKAVITKPAAEARPFLSAEARMHLPRLLIIAVLGFIVYGNSLNSPFIFDDVYIIGNPDLHDISDLTTVMGTWINFRPVLALTFALNYHFSGANPFGFHVVNILLHISIGMMLYFLVYRVISLRETDLPKGSMLPNLTALWTALFFIAHPIQTESIAYIWGRSAVLCTFFYVLALLLFVRAIAGSRESGKAADFSRPKFLWNYIASIACFLLAMGSKEIALSLPIILVFYSFLFISNLNLKDFFTKTAWYSLPFVAISGIRTSEFLRYTNFTGLLSAWFKNEDATASALTEAAVLPVAAQQPEPARSFIAEVQHLIFEENLFHLTGFTLPEHINQVTNVYTQLRVFIEYIRLMIFPSGLNADYDFVVSRTMMEPEIIISIIMILLSIGALFYFLKKAPFISFGIVWFLAGNIIFFSVPLPDIMVERRMYLPGIGFFIALAAGIYHCTAYFIKKKPRANYEKWGIGICIVILLLYSYGTIQRNIIWQDKVVFWKDVIKKSPNKARAYNNLGIIYLNNSMYDLAIKYFQLGVDKDPEHGSARTNLIMALYVSGAQEQNRRSVDQSILKFKETWEDKPDHAIRWLLLQLDNITTKIYYPIIFDFEDTLEQNDAHNGNHLVALGLAYLRVFGDNEKAIHYFEAGLEKGCWRFRRSVVRRLIKAAEAQLAEAV